MHPFNKISSNCDPAQIISFHPTDVDAEMSVQNTNYVNSEENVNIKSLNDVPENIKEALVRIIEKENYIKCTVTKRMISTNGGNFIAILYEVDIKGTTIEGEKEINLFVKEAKVFKKIRIISIDNIYSNELYFYNEFANIINDLQNEASVPENEKIKLPKGYKESTLKAIILENVARKGFKMFNRINDMTLKFAELSIEQLAKLHGLSFVIQNRSPEFYERSIKNKKQPMIFDADWRIFINNLCNKVIEVLDSPILQDKIKHLVPKLHNNYQEYLMDSTPVGVLCHGDYRPQNIMMRDVNSQIEEVMALDYQLIYYGCPVTDFLFFIFSGTDQQFRKNYLEHLKTIYHESLRRFLCYFDMDVETVFPRKQFERIYEDRLGYGLMTGIYVSYFQFIPQDEVPDLGSRALSELAINPSEGFTEWIHGLIDDFVQWGYL